MNQEGDSHANASHEDAQRSYGHISSIGPYRKINFSITSTDSNAGGPTEAFRELLQHWRDQIIASFKLAPDQFNVVREERVTGAMENHILYKVTDPAQHQQCLGYILFSHLHGYGTIEIANRNSTFGLWRLGRRTINQADAHEEGVKHALLVLQRPNPNYVLQCVAGGFRWSFHLTTHGSLAADLYHITREQFEFEKTNTERRIETALDLYEIDPFTDVKLRISGQTLHPQEVERGIQRDDLSLEEFNKWCEAALFLQQVPEDGIVRTPRGDLITDDRLRGNLYLKGILLQIPGNQISARSITAKPLKFGYNFHDGMTNRERRSAMNVLEEGQAILGIWDLVLMKKPDYVVHLHAMLLSTAKFADVSESGRSMSLTTAVRLQQFVFADPAKWYYSPTEKSKVPQLAAIIQGLGRTGMELPDLYWTALEKHKLLRTAEEEQRQRLLSAEIVPVPHNDFAKEVYRLVRGCLQATALTGDVTVQFVRAGRLSLDTFHVPDQRLLMIHEKWLSRGDSIRELGLPQPLEDVDVLFHITKRLLSDVLDRLPEDRYDDSTYSSSWQRKNILSCAEQRLLYHMRIKDGLSLDPSADTAGELTLRWGHGLSWGGNCWVTIQLHVESTCLHLRNHSTGRDLHGTMACLAVHKPLEAPATERVKGQTTPQCRTVGCRIKDASYAFTRLQESTEYFAVMFKPFDPDCIAIISKPATSTPARLASSAMKQKEDTAKKTYTLGPALTTLDLLQARDWHEAIGQGKRKGVIGIAKERPEDEGIPKKRQRVEE